MKCRLRKIEWLARDHQARYDWAGVSARLF